MKLLHTADTHIGYAQYREEQREVDFIDAFRTVIDDAIDENVDGVVHAGDLFHRSRPSIGALRDTFGELKRLHEHGIPFYMVVGNHDGTRDTQWSELIEELNIGHYLDYSGVKEGDVALYGQDHVPKNRRGELTYEFNEVGAEVNVLVAHGLFTQFGFGKWDVEEIIAQSPVDFDVVLLGDDHEHQIEFVDSVPVTYCGSTERTAADQRGERGYNMISISDSDIDVEYRTIDTRPFTYIDFEVKEDTQTRDVVDEIESSGVRDGAVVIVTLTGLMSDINISSIEKTADREGALTVQVNDRRVEQGGEDREYENVDFVDPDEVVEKKINEKELASHSTELELLVRDESVPKSNLKSKTESIVETMLDDGELDAEVSVGDGTEVPDEVVGSEQVTMSDVGGDDE